MSRPITISPAQLRKLLAGIKHATPFTATTLTDAGARKTANPHGTVYKLTRVNGMTGTDYEAAVLRQQEREGERNPTFTAQPRAWGQQVAPALVEHKGSYYLPAQLNPIITPKPLYLVARDRKLVAVPKAAVAPWLPADRSADKAAMQGVEREVVKRDFSLSSIMTLSIGGQKYRVRQSSTP